LQAFPPGPLEASASSPPERQARRHWYTDFVLTPQQPGDLDGIHVLREHLSGLQPHPLPASPAIRGQPATIRIPHTTGLTPPETPVTQARRT
jgi:hypothetical protein